MHLKLDQWTKWGKNVCLVNVEQEYAHIIIITIIKQWKEQAQEISDFCFIYIYDQIDFFLSFVLYSYLSFFVPVLVLWLLNNQQTSKVCTDVMPQVSKRLCQPALRLPVVLHMLIPASLFTPPRLRHYWNNATRFLETLCIERCYLW